MWRQVDCTFPATGSGRAVTASEPFCVSSISRIESPWQNAFISNACWLPYYRGVAEEDTRSSKHVRRRQWYSVTPLVRLPECLITSLLRTSARPHLASHYCVALSYRLRVYCCTNCQQFCARVLRESDFIWPRRSTRPWGQTNARVGSLFMLAVLHPHYCIVYTSKYLSRANIRQGAIPLPRGRELGPLFERAVLLFCIFLQATTSTRMLSIHLEPGLQCSHYRENVIDRYHIARATRLRYPLRCSCPQVSSRLLCLSLRKEQSACLDAAY